MSPSTAVTRKVRGSEARPGEGCLPIHEGSATPQPAPRSRGNRPGTDTGQPPAMNAVPTAPFLPQPPPAGPMGKTARIRCHRCPGSAAMHGSRHPRAPFGLCTDPRPSRRTRARVSPSPDARAGTRGPLRSPPRAPRRSGPRVPGPSPRAHPRPRLSRPPGPGLRPARRMPPGRLV